MAQSRAGNRIDWELFLLLVVGAQGFARFIPEYPGRQHMVLSGVLLAVFAIRNPNRIFGALFSRPLLLFAVFWSLAASFTAAHLAETLASAVVLLLLVAYSLQRRSTTAKTLRTFAVATSLSLVPSIVGLVVPLGVPVRFGGSTGGYAGYFQWNSLSGLCAATALASIAALYLTGGFMVWHVPAAAGAVLMLVLANSASTYICSFAALAAFVATSAMGRFSERTRPLITVGFGLFLVLLLTNIDRAAILPIVGESLGRDETFTGRTEIWQYGVEKITEAVYWGYGSGVWETHKAGSAQNGFLDVALKWGLPTFLALVAIVLLAGYRLTVLSSPLLPLWTIGFIANLSGSQLAAPAVASLALWIAVGSTASVAVGATTGSVSSNELSNAPNVAENRSQVVTRKWGDHNA